MVHSSLREHASGILAKQQQTAGPMCLGIKPAVHVSINLAETDCPDAFVQRGSTDCQTVDNPKALGFVVIIITEQMTDYERPKIVRVQIILIHLSKNLNTDESDVTAIGIPATIYNERNTNNYNK